MSPPTDSPNPFVVLGLPATFDLDTALVHRSYLARIASVHPDAGEADESLAADLHLARDVLSNPESRADALLRLRGDERPSPTRDLPTGFLAEIMGIREEIEASASDPAARTHWATWAAQERAEFALRVSALFAKDAPTPEIRRTLNAWRYIERLIEQLDHPGGVPDRRG
ncbi:MAG: iron-sulfur cluster co-chaperone HscB C-terminal domain-containing protein [Phycisphaerales bacterium]